MTQWDPNRWETEEAGPSTGTNFALSWIRELPRARFSHRVGFDPTEMTASPLDLCATVARFVCHVLVDELPDRALPELFESLQGMQEFYLEGPNQPALLPVIRTLHAELGDVRERPRFQLDAEDEY